LVEKLNKMHHADILSDEEFDKSLKRVIAHYRNLKFALSANELPTRLALPPAQSDNEESDLATTDAEDD
jgi:heme oxygenase